MSTKNVVHSPLACKRRNVSRTKLVLPIRRGPTTNVWLPARTRSERSSTSMSRSKNESPCTQLPPAFFILPAASFPQRSCCQQNCCINSSCCQAETRIAQSCVDTPRNCGMGPREENPLAQGVEQSV